MARRTFVGSGVIEQDRLRVNLLEQLVASLATNIAVHSLQRELRTLVVIEGGRLPFHAVVAIRAGGYVIGSTRELGAVNVLVALFAFHGRCMKVSIRKLGAHIGRLVAVDAGDYAMSANQSKASLGVIKLR